MFEQSLIPFADGRQVRRTRWIIAVSLALQLAALLLLVVIPLLYPAQLPPFHMARLKTVELVRPRRPIPIKPVVVKSNDSASRTPSVSAVLRTTAPTLARPTTAVLAEPPLLPYGEGRSGMTGVSNVLDGSPGTITTTPIVVRQEPAPNNRSGPVRLSSGVTSGMLLSPIRPDYPQIAKMTRTEGTVVVTARIDTSGRIVNLRVIKRATHASSRSGKCSTGGTLPALPPQRTTDRGRDDDLA